MSKIGIYSDVHISHNSSILPTYISDDSYYSTRLEMCKDSLTWAYKEFEKQNVELVVNCGDTFNSHTISSDELSTYVDVIKNIYNPYDKWVPSLDITLIGNHDRFNERFSSLEMVKLTNYSTLIQDFYYCDRDNYDIYFISFYDTDEFIDNVLKMLEKYPRQHEHAILFMHGDINGSCLTGNKRIENHIGTDFLTKYFDIVFNGHIHCHELIYNKDDKRIYNIGSLTTHSFADSNSHRAACWIFDTETGLLEEILNPYQISFKTYEVNNDEDLSIVCGEIQFNTFKHVVKIKCPFDIKDKIEDKLLKLNNILKYKFVFSYNNEIKDQLNDNEKEDNLSTDIKDEFITFLKERDDLKGNINEYVSIVKGEHYEN